MAAALATESGKRPGEFEASKEHSLSAMSAYRGLQLKVRDAERTRDSALRERDEIKRQIYEKNRRDSLMRSRVMSNTSEKLLGIQADNDRILKEARAERDGLLKEAREIKQKMIDDAKDKAKTQAAQIMTQAQAAIESEKQAAVAELKQQVASLSIEIAEKVTKETLSDDKKQTQLGID